MTNYTHFGRGPVRRRRSDSAWVGECVCGRRFSSLSGVRCRAMLRAHVLAGDFLAGLTA